MMLLADYHSDRDYCQTQSLLPVLLAGYLLVSQSLVGVHYLCLICMFAASLFSYPPGG